jgi:hypothetical protein
MPVLLLIRMLSRKKTNPVQNGFEQDRSAGFNIRPASKKLVETQKYVFHYQRYR